MVRLLFSMAFVLVLARSCLAEDLYVSQGGAGASNASNCANAWSLATLNTSGNWGVGASKVSAGDTVRLCGTFSSQLQILGSGTSGNVITITAESGSTFSTTHWTSAAIRAAANVSYIRLTGLTITATSSGTGLSAGTSSAMEFVGACDNCEFDHLTITDLYVRTAQSRDTAAPNGIAINYTDVATNMDNVLIHDNTFTHALRGVFLVYPTGTSNNYQFYNNACSQAGSCIWIGSGGSARTLDDVLIYGNEVSDLEPWSGCFNAGCPGDNWHHCDGLLHAYAAHGTSFITGLEVYNNYLHGNSCNTTELGSSTTTSWIFVEGTGGGSVTSPLVYNNVIAAGYTADGQIYIKGSTGAGVYNNTIVSTTSTTSIGCLNSAVTMKNNISVQVNGTPTVNEGSCTGTTDYNNFYGNSYSAWLGVGTNGTTSAPLLTAGHRLVTGSPGKDTGADVSASCAGCAADKNETPRPYGSGWDMGAFEFAPPSAPTGLREVTP
jgi:hypothetical protein